jgi:threonine/homoserine/homoserine lactone efflux protein
MIGTLLAFFAVGLATIVAIGIALAAFGLVFSVAWGLATFILFKVAPIVFIGWVVLKLFDRRKSRGELSAADREWLESGR